jgi:hypothetical protein
VVDAAVRDSPKPRNLRPSPDRDSVSASTLQGGSLTSAASRERIRIAK